jgi:hypothetical protein
MHYVSPACCCSWGWGLQCREASTHALLLLLLLQALASHQGAAAGPVSGPTGPDLAYLLTTMQLPVHWQGLLLLLLKPKVMLLLLLLL